MATHNGPPGGVLLDLGTSDVHVPAAGGGAAAAYAQAPKPPKAKVKAPPIKVGKKKIGVRVRAQLAKGGYLHVRHMDLADGEKVAHLEELKDGSYRLRDFRNILQGQTADPASVGVTLKGPPTWRDGSAKQLVWVQLAEVGSWKGHSAGPFEMTPKTFSEMVRNFERRGLAIPFDMEHASEASATSGTIPQGGAPAHGWAHKLENRNEQGLWGLVEWLDYARDGIQEGHFAFLSPAIRFNSRDPVTGENCGARLTSVAITNQPFLTNLEGLRAAADRPAEKDSMPDFQIKDATKTVFSTTTPPGCAAFTAKPEEYMPALRACLRADGLAPLSECADLVERLRGHVELAGDAEGVVEGITLADFTRPLAHLVDAKAGDDWDVVFDTAQALITMAMPKAPAPQVPAAPITPPPPAAVTETTPPNAAALTTKEPPMTTAANDDKNKDTAAQIAELSLGLKDVQGKLSENEKLIAAKDAEMVTLRGEIAKRDEKARADRVEEAFETYKDKKNLTDLDKPMMSVFLTANAEGFEKLYPRVPASQRHLLADLTTKRQPNAGGAVPPNAGAEGAGAGGSGGTATESATPPLSEIAQRLATEKGIELGEAQRIVYTAARNASAA